MQGGLRSVTLFKALRLDAVRGEALRTAVRASARRLGGAAPAALLTEGPLDILQKGVQFELLNKCCNVKGRTGHFNEFVFNTLQLLVQRGELQPSAATNDLQQQAWEYRHMSPQERQIFCSSLMQWTKELAKRSAPEKGGSLDEPGLGATLASRPPDFQSARHSHPSSAASAQLPAPAHLDSTGGWQLNMINQRADHVFSTLQQTVALPPAVQPDSSSSAPPPLQVAPALPETRLEWDLTFEEQQQFAFQPPEPAMLQRAVPVVFDLETTDLKGYVAEIGAVAVHSGETFSRLVRPPPGVKMSPGAVQVTQLTDERLAEHGEPFAKVYSDLWEFLKRQVDTAGPGAYLVLAGHNIAAFDLAILRKESNRTRQPFLRHACYVDTLKLAAKVFPKHLLGTPGQPESLKLPVLYAHFTGTPPKISHRAVEDCQSNVVVLENVLQLKFQQPGLGVVNLVHQAVESSIEGFGWANAIGSTASEAARRSPVKRRNPMDPSSKFSLVDTLAAGAATDLELESADPLTATEELDADSDVVAQERLRQVGLLKQGWLAIQQDPELRESFLTAALSRQHGGFTPRQQEALAGAGITTIGQVLDCYPSRLMVSVPGRLPEETDEAPVVTLVARRIAGPVFKDASKGTFMKAVYQAVHPSEAGFEAPWLPRDAYAGRACKLQIFDYRVRIDHRARYVLLNNKKLLDEAGEVLVLQGPVKLQQKSGSSEDSWQFTRWELLRPDAARVAFSQPSNTAQVQVVHPSKGQVASSAMANYVGKALKAAEDAWERGVLRDPLPDWVLEEYQLQPLMAALRGVHRPGDEGELDAARQRLAFQELLALQLKLLVNRKIAWAELSGGGGVRVSNNKLLALALEALPYELTGGQQTALDSILGQMRGWPPMQCLLQGDVGCGKTIVAFLALLAAVGSGYQGAIMAPTEILADQHFRNLKAFVQDITRQAGRNHMPGFKQPRIELVTGSAQGKARRQIDEGMASGTIDIAVGTHALISESTQFLRLGLAVVDEQHKFGVEQRGRLLSKSVVSPHVLHMTATPIPRTQALIDHGNMTSVLIQELPAGRSPIKTSALADNSPERQKMYEHIRHEMAQGHCIYIVCPFVDTSDKLAEVKAATSELERLVSGGVFASQDCGLLHGQMSPEAKDAVLQRFKAGEVKVLVSTTVVEVGVDVPQATVIVIEHAERFGFAQLHQLRGRVGRSDRQSYCYLVYPDGAGPGTRKKMKVLVNCNNGFTVAECDLELRGAGEVLGKRQSGRDVNTSFKVAQIPADRALLEQARQAAAMLLQRQPDPREWRAELRSLVMDDDMLRLDTHTLPKVS